MAADSDSTKKSKDRKDRRSEDVTDEGVNRGGPVEINELETIPTVVPREGDGYRSSRQEAAEQEQRPIGEPGFTLTEDDLRRVNSRKGLIDLLKYRDVDIQEVLKTLLYEQELRQLQVELVKLQLWVQSTGQRIAILVEGRDAAGKGGTIRRFTEHLNPRAMRVVALPKPTDEERGQWYFQRYIRQLPNKGEIVFFDRSWYNRAVVEPVMGFCTKREHQRFLQQVPEFEHMLYEDGVIIIKFWFSISKDEQAKRFEARRQNPLKQWKISPIDKEALRYWKDYSEARNEMLLRTNFKQAPWFVVNANDKNKSHIAIINHLLNQVDYHDKNEKLLAHDYGIVHPATKAYIKEKLL